MKRRWQRLLITVFAAFLAMVGVQVLWPFIPQFDKLHGVTSTPPPVTWSWLALRRGDTARQVEAWYNVRVGLRNFWVALDNQVSYSLFGEVTPRTEGARIVAGPHDWFFEYQYIQTAVSPGWWTPDMLKAAVARLKSVQEKLARRGVPLLLVVAPSKVELYPEHVPAALFAGRQPADFTTNFEMARPLLQAAGINFYDGPARFAAWKAAGDHDLFARSGVHWSYFSTVHVLREIRERLNPVMRHPLPELKVAAMPIGPPRVTDKDLLDTANLLISSPYEHPLPYPVLTAQYAVPTEELPRLLWVHDSFGWLLIDQLYAAHAVRPSESLYYFKTCYHIPGGTKTDLDLNKINWDAFLKSYDAVVVVWTEIAFDFESWGFIETLDRELK
jgi:hypothetical protein